MERTSSTRIGFFLRQTDLLLSAFLALAVLGLFPTMWAQTSTTGLLRGVVTDPAGRVVSNADVRVTNRGNARGTRPYGRARMAPTLCRCFRRDPIRSISMLRASRAPRDLRGGHNGNRDERLDMPPSR